MRAVPSGPTGGLSGKKIGVGAVMFLRLPFPNQRPGGGFHRRGGYQPPVNLPLKGKADSPCRGEISRRDKRDREAGHRPDG